MEINKTPQTVLEIVKDSGIQYKKLYKTLKLSFPTFVDRLEDPSSFTVLEIILLAPLLHLHPKALFEIIRVKKKRKDQISEGIINQNP